MRRPGRADERPPRPVLPPEPSGEPRHANVRSDAHGRKLARSDKPKRHNADANDKPKRHRTNAKETHSNSKKG